MADGILKRCSKCGEDKPLSEFPLCRGKPRARCKPCHVSDARAWALENHEVYKAQLRKWHMANVPPRFMGPPLPPHILRERNRAATKRWREANVDAFAAMRKAWAAENKHVQMETVRRRQAAKLQATPKWASRKVMQSIYAEAVALSRIDGIQRDVDHIVPLISKRVCGLHCEANLQVLPRKENRMKHNIYWPDMWEPV
jgi:hypothetical protein